MIIVVIAVVTGSLAIRYLPILLVEFAATIMAVWQTISVQSLHRALADRGSQHGSLDNDRKSTAADRRLLKRALRATLRQTQTASLIPHVARRAEIIVASVGY